VILSRNAATGFDASSSTSSVQGTVISAWAAAQAAFEDAARTADPRSPELATTTVAPQLSWAESFLTLVQAAGEFSLGPVSLGRPRVVALGSELATVQSCVYDREVVVSATTRRPVPGVLGQVDYELFTSIMERTAGGWKLANQIVKVGLCHGP
jgi:hypothetical protein